jgi:hypothetical protein
VSFSCFLVFMSRGIWTIILKSGPAGRLTRNPGLEPSRVEEKTRGKKNPVWPDGLTRRPGWLNKTRLQPVDFCFLFSLLKWRRFDFLKKKLTRMTWSKSRTQALDWTAHQAESKNYGLNSLSFGRCENVFYLFLNLWDISKYFICYLKLNLIFFLIFRKYSYIDF